MVGEKDMRGFNGWFMLIALTAVVLGAVWQLVEAIKAESFWMLDIIVISL